MKYQCVCCQKIFDENLIVMLTNSSGFGGTWIEPHCVDCVAIYKNRVKR